MLVVFPNTPQSEDVDWYPLCCYGNNNFLCYVSSSDNASVKKISRQKRWRQERKNKKKSKDNKSRDEALEDLEDGVLPPPIPPHTSDMYISATVSSTSTASTQSTSLDDDTAVTDSVFGDDSMTGTPIQAHLRTITFTATIENVSGVDVDSSPPIPPRTNEMHFLVNNTSATRIKTASLSDNLRRGCFITDELIVGRNSDTESRLAHDEYEADGYCEPADDTSSQSSIDIGFPPPIPPKTRDMFLVQNFNPNDCTTVQIPMKLNGSYIPVTKTAVS